MFAAFLLVVVMMNVAVAGTLPNPALDDRWQQFKVKFDKHYTPEEEPDRRMRWEGNLKKIEEHNRQPHSFQMEENTFCDMSPEEFRSRKKFTPAHRMKTTGDVHRSPVKLDIPDSIDWRDKGLVTKVKDQGICNDCWAFSAVGTLEGQLKKNTGNLVTLSEQNLVDCTRYDGNEGCKGEGGYVEVAFEYVRENGISTEKSYPYVEDDDTCKLRDPGTVVAYCEDYRYTIQFDEFNLQAAVGLVGPVAVSIDSSSDEFHLYSSGIFDYPQCNSTVLDHGVLAVGYGTENGKDFWLVKNSWGEKWGMNGYVKMARNKNNQCGIATNGIFPIGVSDSPSISYSVKPSSITIGFVIMVMAYNV